jgi:WD40 repeat protein
MRAQGHAKDVRCVAWAAGGSVAASAGRSGAVHLWQPASHEALGALQVGNAVLQCPLHWLHAYMHACMRAGLCMLGSAGACLPHGMLVSQSGLSTAGLPTAHLPWAVSCTMLNPFHPIRCAPCLSACVQGHVSGAECVALSADGALAVSGGRDAMLRLWRVGSKECATSLRVRVRMRAACMQRPCGGHERLHACMRHAYVLASSRLSFVVSLNGACPTQKAPLPSSGHSSGMVPVMLSVPDAVP